MLPWQRPTSVPSGILIHPTVWPQYTTFHQRYRQTNRTDNGPIAWDKPLLVTVAQNKRVFFSEHFVYGVFHHLATLFHSTRTPTNSLVVSRCTFLVNISVSQVHRKQELLQYTVDVAHETVDNLPCLSVCLSVV